MRAAFGPHAARFTTDPLGDLEAGATTPRRCGARAAALRRRFPACASSSARAALRDRRPDRLSPEGRDAAHELAAGWFREAGFEVEVDAAGNLIGRDPRRTREVWTGSHLDMVPGAGRFDGTLGVVAGLEASRAARDARARRRRLPRRGARLLGSRAAARRRSRRLPRAPHRAGPDAPPRRCAARGRPGDRRLRTRAELTFAGTPAMRRRRWTSATTRSSSAASSCCMRGEVARGIRRRRHRRPDYGRAGRHERDPRPGRRSASTRVPDAERLDRLVAALEIEEPIRMEPVAMAEEIRAAVRSESRRSGCRC